MNNQPTTSEITTKETRKIWVWTKAEATYLLAQSRANAEDRTDANKQDWDTVLNLWNNDIEAVAEILTTGEAIHIATKNSHMQVTEKYDILVATN